MSRSAPSASRTPKIFFLPWLAPRPFVRRLAAVDSASLLPGPGASGRHPGADGVRARGASVKVACVGQTAANLVVPSVPCVFLRSLPGASRHPARWCLPPPLCTRTLALALRLCAWAAPPVAVEPLAKGEASNASGCHTDKCGLLQSLLQKQRHFLCVSFPLQRNRPSVQVLLDSVLKVGCLLDVRQHAALQVAETIHIDVAVCAPLRLVRKSVVSHDPTKTTRAYRWIR